jgi:hypothetical protein
MLPQIMVMGDSLGQGCRNLSVTSLNCSQCYAGIIAGEMGWTLRKPAYPQPALFDLLNVISELDIDLPIVIPELLIQLRDNIDFWSSKGWMQPAGTVHDNIAITGATYDDLFTNPAQFYRDRITALAQQSVLQLLGNKLPGTTLSDLHLAITAMYALNPEGDNSPDPNAWKNTAFSIIQARRPENLFVDIGHNGTDSHFFGSGGDAIPLKNPAPDYGFNPDTYIATMTNVVDKLVSLNAGGGSPIKIYMSVLPKLSAVAALNPSGMLKGGYYDLYEPTLSVSKYTLTRDQIATLDQAVQNANNIVAAYAAKQDPKNIVIVDYYSFFTAIDYKNSKQGSADASKQIVIGSNRIDNRYVIGKDVWYPDPTSSKPRGHFGCVFEQGGFQSVDGMHPSAVGYVKVAIEILTKYMGQAIAPATEAALFQAAFAGDPLLSHFPINLEPIIGTLKVIRRAEGSSETIQGNDVPVATAINILNGNNSTISRNFVSSIARQSNSS